MVQLVLELDHTLQLPDLPVRLVADQRTVEVNSEYDEHDAKGDHDARGGDGGRFAGADLAIVLVLGAPQWQELDPAQEHHLRQEQQGANDCGEGPGQLDVAVHALMW